MARARSRRSSTAATRCSFVDGTGRRCVRNGTGRPPLCRACRLAVEDMAAPPRPRSNLADLVDDIRGGKKIRSEKFVGALFEVLAGYGAYRAATAGASNLPFNPYAGPRANVRPPPPPPPPPQPPDPDKIARLEARKTLGFSAKEPLDRDKIKHRHRELAKQHHPDLGGSTAKMAAINAAAELLVQGLPQMS